MGGEGWRRECREGEGEKEMGGMGKGDATRPIC